MRIAITGGSTAVPTSASAGIRKSFDPDYPTEPIETFEPMLREVFSRQPFDPAIVGEVDAPQSAAV